MATGTDTTKFTTDQRTTQAVTTTTAPTTNQRTTKTDDVTRVISTSSGAVSDASDEFPLIITGVVLGAFFIGLATAAVSVCLYRRCVRRKQGSAGALSLPIEEQRLARKDSSRHGSFQGPYSVVDIGKYGLDDGYAEIKAGEVPKSTQNSGQKPKRQQEAPFVIPRPALSPAPTQIEVNTRTNIQIKSHNSVEGIQEDYYLELLPEEIPATITDDDVYEDVIDKATSGVNRNAAIANARLNKASVAQKPKPQTVHCHNTRQAGNPKASPIPKPRKKAQYSNVTPRESLNESAVQSSPNVVRKSKLGQSAVDSGAAITDTALYHNEHVAYGSNDRNEIETDELYENVTSWKKTINVSRSSDNIMMYVNCVVQEVPEISVESTEL